MVSCKNEDTPDVIVDFTATLDGIQEVPSNATTATGASAAKYNMTTKVLTVTTTHTLTAPTAGHIHRGGAGIAGPVIFPFTTLTSPIVFTSTALTAAQEDSLLTNQYYVNLHTTAFPGGEIRGQLLKAGTTLSNTVNFAATLNGAQENPPTTTTFSGTSTGSFNKTTKIFTVTTTHTVLAPTAGHIHIGDVGVNGPVVFPFTTLTSPIAFTSPALTLAQEADLMNNKHYVNIHTTAFSGGEIRGQLLKQ